MLEARGASFNIGSKLLVEGIDLELRPGKVVALVGPNGAGKSTLLRLFAGEIAPTSGSVAIDGREVRHVTAVELARRRAVVAQSTSLSFPFTVLEVVLLGATVPGFAVNAPHAESSARRAIETVGLAGFEDRLFTRLSGGERQRVHIARALCQLVTASRRRGESSALLLDEPTASLDLAHQRIVFGEARRQADAGRIVLAILHDLNLAAAYADEIVVMDRGRIAAAGSARDVLRDELLSAVYCCPVRTNAAPVNGAPFVLPGPAAPQS